VSSGAISTDPSVVSSASPSAVSVVEWPVYSSFANYLTPSLTISASSDLFSISSNSSKSSFKLF
jgi:hypothetical protein